MGGYGFLTSGEVSVLDLVNLELKILVDDPDYGFVSETNCFNISKSGEIYAVVKNEEDYSDMISFSKASKKV